MSKILIITDSFTPDFSPRVSFLAKNLAESGDSVTLFSEDIEAPFYEIDVKGVEVRRDLFFKSRPNSFFRSIEWSVKATLNLLFDYKSYFFYKKWKKYISTEYDFIFCSTFSYFPLKSAYLLSKHLSVPFIVDVRDLAEQFTNREYQLHSCRVLVCLNFS